MVENYFIKWHRYILISIWIHLIVLSLYVYTESKHINFIHFNTQSSASSSNNNNLTINLQKNNSSVHAPKNLHKSKASVGTKKAINKNTIIAKNPTFSKQTPLYYPPRAVEMGLMGTIKLKAWVNKKGDIEQLVILKSSSYQILDDATIGTVKSWQVNPIIRDNQAIAGWVEFSVNYNIKNS